MSAFNHPTEAIAAGAATPPGTETSPENDYYEPEEGPRAPAAVGIPPKSHLAQVCDLWERVAHLRYTNHENVIEYIEEFRNIQSQHKKMGKEPDEPMLVSMFFSGLSGPNWTDFKYCQLQGRTIVRAGSDATTPLVRLDDLVMAAQHWEEHSRLFSQDQPRTIRGPGSDKYPVHSVAGDQARVPYSSHYDRLFHTQDECGQLHPELAQQQYRDQRNGSRPQKRQRSDTTGDYYDMDVD